MNVCLYFHGFMLCFMLASTVHNLDCYSTSVYLWLCILFLLIVNLLLTLGFILIMCVHLQLYSFCLFYFVCRSFLLIYSIRLCLSLQFPLSSLNFLVLLHAFWWWMLFNCFALCLFHLLLPLPPCFLLLFVLFFGLFVCLFVFCLFFCRHFIFSSICYYDCYSYDRFYYRRFFAKIVLLLSVCNLYQGQVARQAFVP